MTDDPISEPTEYRFGSTVVIIDSSKPPGAPGTRVHIFRVRRNGIVRAYRLEVEDSQTGHMQGEELARYLMLHARHRSMLFPYEE